jgi:phage terminase large subunit-like protein
VSAVAEREAETRDELIRAFASVCPGIHGNPYIPHWPTPPQQLFLGLHMRADAGAGVFEAMFGGAAGGGKSDCLLMAAAQFADDPVHSALVVRKTFSDLSLPGAIMDRAITWWKGIDGVHWDGSAHTFTFRSGAKVQFGYMKDAEDHLRYKSAEFQTTLWDELTELPLQSQYMFVGNSRVRRPSGSGLPLRTLSATNPGGPGHDWVRERFVGEPWAGVAATLPNRYIPARVRDNPFIDQESYIESLSRLHPTVREQMLNGDWRARDPGDYFRAEWFGPLLDPEVEDLWPASDCVRVRWWDLAASEREDAAKTAGVRMARHRSGVRAIEHCRSFRATPGKRDDLIVQTAHADGRTVVVGIEIEPGSGGIAQFEALKVRLESQGFRVAGARPKQPHQTEREERLIVRSSTSMASKQGRADPVASCLERGYQRRGEQPVAPDAAVAPWYGLDRDKPVAQQRDGIRLWAGPWTSNYLSIVEGFPDAATCDEVDATSGAWAWLEAHPMGLRTLGAARPAPRPATAETHPDDRPDPDDSGWRKPR